MRKEYVLAIKDGDGEISTGLFVSDTEPVKDQYLTIKGSDSNGHDCDLSGSVIAVLFERF